MKKILLIGCGHMGGALLNSWLIGNKYSLTVVDPIKYKLLNKKFGHLINVKKNINSLEKIFFFNYVIFAVRPVELKNIFHELSNKKFANHTSIISVIAGKKINVFEKNFPNVRNIFRVMPNMPASIGQSMNCIVAKKNVTLSKKRDIIKLFSCSGETLMLEDENQIDMATAISGSGPGFIFNLIDAMEKAAIKLGFTKKTANILVSQTFRGSINLLLKNKISPKTLVSTIATKGGTTEAGLKVMNKREIHKIFIELTKASFKKAKEQGK